MKTVIVSSNLFDTFDANHRNTTYVITSGGDIEAPTLGIGAYNKAANRDFIINGKVDGGNNAGIDVGDIISRKGAGDLQVGVNGTVTGYTCGILTNGNGQTIENAGTIHSAQVAVLAGGNMTRIVNSGSVSSDIEGIALFGTDSLLKNHGVITATDCGVVLAVSRDKLINTGTVSGDTAVNMGQDLGQSGTVVVNHGTLTGGTFAIHGYDNREIVKNDGSIYGNIDLGGGRDLFDNRGGAVYGSIRGGAGDDTYLVKSATASLVEDHNGGRDTVKSSVSFTLADNFETLILTGKTDIYGSGNTGNNHLVGNAGNNMLVGYEGHDNLSGGKGDDYLFGGADADTFIFKTGFGHDSIMDLTASGKDHDRIDLSQVSGIDTFAELKALMHDHGGDVVIDFGHGDKLTLGGVHEGDLQESDFHF